MSSYISSPYKAVKIWPACGQMLPLFNKSREREREQNIKIQMTDSRKSAWCSFVVFQRAIQQNMFGGGKRRGNLGPLEAQQSFRSNSTQCVLLWVLV